MRTLFVCILLLAIAAGCKKQEQDEQSIKVYIPNAFRPDDESGINSNAPCSYGEVDCNRVFKVVVSNPDKVNYEFEIGVSSADEELFHSNDPRVGWNGKAHQDGDMMPKGVYTYMIKIKQLNNGSVKVYTGELMLLR